MKIILVYSDHGVNYGTLAQTVDTLTSFFQSKCNIRLINASAILDL